MRFGALPQGKKSSCVASDSVTTTDQASSSTAATPAKMAARGRRARNGTMAREPSAKPTTLVAKKSLRYLLVMPTVVTTSTVIAPALARDPAESSQVVVVHTG